MNLSCKLFVATFAVGAVVGSAAFVPLAAAPITLLDGLRKAPAVDVQTVQQGGLDTVQQYGLDYSYYGPRYRSTRSGDWNRGERSSTRSQYGLDYGYYGPRYRSGSSPTRNPGERSPTETQYGPDYRYYGR
jgi:hypothetical protein